jgi:hypothetical protein
VALRENPLGGSPSARYRTRKRRERQLPRAPRFTLERVGDDWLDLFAGGFLVLGAAIVAPLFARGRRVAAGAAAAAGSLLIWMNAPFTAASVPEWEAATASVVRYLLPALATGTLTLALVAASRCRLARSFGLLFLVAGLVLNVVQTARLGFPSVPGVEVPILGAALGAGVAGLVPWARVRTPPLSLAGERSPLRWPASGLGRHWRPSPPAT